MEWQYYTTRDSFGYRMRRELVPVGETIKVPVVEPAPVAGEAVTFEFVVELWATEKKVAKPSKRQMLSKAKRFAAFLENDRQSRGLPHAATTWAASAATKQSATRSCC